MGEVAGVIDGSPRVVIGDRDGPVVSGYSALRARVAVTRVVARAAIFEGFGPADADAAIPFLDGPVHFARRQIVFAEGDPGDRLYLVVAGTVKVGRRAADGRGCLLAILGPSDVFGELALFDPGPRASTATAVSNVTVVSMDRSAMRNWIRDRPESAEQMLGALARRLRRTQDDLTYLGSASVAARLAAQLLTLAERFGIAEGGTVKVSHGLTQDEIASLVGSSRETVGKVLTEFSRRGWIRVIGRSVTIVDAERLGIRARCPAVPSAEWAVIA